jgi:hypothetical protein
MRCKHTQREGAAFYHSANETQFGQKYLNTKHLSRRQRLITDATNTTMDPNTHLVRGTLKTSELPSR